MPRRLVAWLPWALLLAGLITSTALWSTLLAHQQRSAQALLDFRLRALTETVETSLSSLSYAIIRAGEWWDELGGTPEPAWRSDALAILHDFPALAGLQWIDRDFRVRWDTTQAGDAAAENPTLTPEERTNARRAQADKRPVLALRTAKGGRLVDVMVPLTGNGAFSGWMRGTVDLQRLLDQVYDQMNLTSHLQIYNDGELLAGVRGPAAAGSHPFVAAAPMEFMDLRLQGLLLPSAEFLDQTNSTTPEAVFVIGILATLILAGMARQFTILSAKDRALRAAVGALCDSQATAAAHRTHIEAVYTVAPVGLCMLGTDLGMSMSTSAWRGFTASSRPISSDARRARSTPR